MSELFGSDFLRKLEKIRLRIQRGRASRAGDRPSSESGEGLEFQDHRGYAPGDDLREIDWNAFARLGRLFRKRYRREQGEEVALLVDLSDSMRLGDPSKLVQAKRLSGALAVLSLASGARLRLLLAGERLSTSVFEGKDAMALCFPLLESAQSGGGKESLFAAMRSLGDASRELDLFVLSDGSFPEGPDAFLETLAKLRARGHAVHFLQVIAPQESDPFAQGTFAGKLVESESGAALDWPGGEALAARYRQVFQEFQEGVGAFCRRHGLMRSVANSELPFDEPLSRILEEAQS